MIKYVGRQRFDRSGIAGARGMFIAATPYTRLLAFGASGESARIMINMRWQVHQAYGLAGRGTSVFCGTVTLAASERSGKVESSGNSPMAGGATAASKPSTELREVTVKIYWQEESRSNEAEGPREASTMGFKMDTLGHHPGPLFARDVPECSTWFIRKSSVLNELKTGVLLISSGWPCSSARGVSPRWSARRS